MERYGREFWDARYADDEYVFGKEPSAFLAENCHHIPAGSRVLVPADGEGRNSVFLAKQGHTVVATDVAAAGLDKARRLAEAHGATIDFKVANVHEWEWPEAEFDAVVGIFIQFSPPELRTAVFAGMMRAVRPGGLVLLHGYTPKQVEYGTGGPAEPDFLYTAELLCDAFAGWDVLRLESHERELSEGHRHKGRSALIDFIARRPTKSHV